MKLRYRIAIASLLPLPAVGVATYRLVSSMVVDRKLESVVEKISEPEPQLDPVSPTPTEPAPTPSSTSTPPQKTTVPVPSPAPRTLGVDASAPITQGVVAAAAVHVPPSASGAVRAEFGSKGIGKATASQQAKLVAVVCLAWAHGWTDDQIIARAMEEDGVTRDGVVRFLAVARPYC